MTESPSSFGWAKTEAMPLEFAAELQLQSAQAPERNCQPEKVQRQNAEAKDALRENKH